MPFSTSLRIVHYTLDMAGFPHNLRQRYYKHRFETPIPTLLPSLLMEMQISGRKCESDMYTVLFGDLHTKLERGTKNFTVKRG